MTEGLPPLSSTVSRATPDFPPDGVMRNFAQLASQADQKELQKTWKCLWWGIPGGIALSVILNALLNH